MDPELSSSILAHTIFAKSTLLKSAAAVINSEKSIDSPPSKLIAFYIRSTSLGSMFNVKTIILVNSS